MKSSGTRRQYTIITTQINTKAYDKCHYSMSIIFVASYKALFYFFNISRLDDCYNRPVLRGHCGVILPIDHGVLLP